MKPVYLEFCGLNSFSESAKIDFATLLKGGVFGIFGDTGSGKSTILDAIHFALYGEVDRVPKSFADCINHRLDGASVTFDFELTKDGTRKTYRVQREKKRKQGASKAYLYERTGAESWSALAESTRDVNERLEEIIGLSFEDFKTCIALPQGDFATLVKATPAERVKLVARLFNLEKYGERLTATIFAKHKQAEEEMRLVLAKMDENAGASKEQIQSLETQIIQSRESLQKEQTALEQTETALKKAETLQREKQEFESLKARLQTLNERLGAMEEMRLALEKLPTAKSVKEWLETLVRTQKAKSDAQTERIKMQAQHAQKTQALAQEKARFESENYDEKILQAGLALTKVQSAKEDYLTAEKAEKEYLACRAEYKQLLKECQSEDFDNKRAVLEQELAELGEDENLLDFLRHNYKGILLSDAYGEFRADLKTIEQKYPQTQAEIALLLEKYTLPVSGAQTVELASVQLAFKQKELQRKQVKTALDELEKRRRAYEENESKRKLLEKQGELLRQNYQIAQEKIASLKELGTETALSERLNALKSAQAQARSRMENMQSSLAELYAKSERLQGVIEEQEKREKEGKEGLQNALKAGGFESENDALTLIAKTGDETLAKAKLQAFFEELSACKRRLAETDEQKFSAFDENALTLLQTEKRERKQKIDEWNRLLGSYEREKKTLLALQEKYGALQKELAEKQKQEKLLDELLKLVRGNKFLEYIASEYLQEICGSASKTLLSLTSGRYFLEYDEKEFKVGDNLDGGAYRAVKTLSGGETFLVSLSLALALSSAICMKSLRPIEFFFLDEGFGTLDEKLVDTVMDVLSKLGKNFSVGLISHVEELKRRIERKILVTPANERHGSQIQIIGY